MGDSFRVLLLVRVTGLGILLIVLLSVSTLLHNKTRIVFCDVGQGDAALIQIQNGIDILVDAGPGRDVLDCLGLNMPLTDTYIDIAVISHPHIDHYGGFTYVLQRYQIGMVLLNADESNSQSYRKLLQLLKHAKIPLHVTQSGDSVTLGTVSELTFFWPTKRSYTDTLYNSDPNALSLVMLYREGFFDALFTGDVSPEVLNELHKSQAFKAVSVELLKVPHHGSQNGLTDEFLRSLHPEISVISVAKTNRYAHPSSSVIDMLRAYGKPYYLTSEKGHIAFEITPDGSFSQR